MIKFLNITVNVMTGAVLSSFFITNTEDWKIYLTILLLALSLRNTIKEN